MEAHAPETDLVTSSSAGANLKTEILAEIEAIGPKLARSVPDFQALYLVGLPALGELEFVETASAWVCDSEMSFVLISGSPIAGPTLRCLQAGIGMRLGGMRIRLRHFHSDWLAVQARKRREGFELMQARRLLAGDGGPVDQMDSSWLSEPSPDAAENLLVDCLELLLRAWPERAMLERWPSTDAERAKLILKGSLTELTRNIGDALLVLNGRYECSLAARRARLAELAVGDAMAAILAWAFGSLPLLEPVPGPEPHSLESAWTALRQTTIATLADAVGRRLGHSIGDSRDLLSNVRNCRRSLRSRLRRLFQGKKRAGDREFTQLMLLLCLALDEPESASKQLLDRAAKLLPLLGGPILANPDWPKLRRETLLLEPWEQRLPGRAHKTTPQPLTIEA